MVEIHGPYIVFGQGKRSNNEDNYTPDNYAETQDSRFFLVCDGMGGAEKGEVASQLAIEVFCKYVAETPVVVPDSDYLADALKSIELAFDAYIEDFPAATGMGTTLALLWFHEKGITIGHIGDSRVYRFRAGELNLLTRDHSLVGELVAAGILTELEAENHPKKNVITRAIQGSHRGGTAMEVLISDDVRPGDVFLLCTDGVTEACPTHILQQMRISHPDIVDFQEAIALACEGESRDNYTGLLVEVAALNGLENPQVGAGEVPLIKKWQRQLKSYFSRSGDKHLPRKT